MRETKNLKLSQFEPNDIPNWLDQYNTDMEKIDTANGSQNVVNESYETRFTNDEEKISNNRNQINENTQDIANIKDDIKNIKGGSDLSLNTLQREITTVEQTVTNLKGGSTRTIAELENDLNTDQQNISALDGRVETLEDSVGNVETKIGNSDISNVGKDITTVIGNEKLLTSKKNISGAINQLYTKAVNLSADITITSTVSLEKGELRPCNLHVSCAPHSSSRTILLNMFPMKRASIPSCVVLLSKNITIPANSTSAIVECEVYCLETYTNAELRYSADNIPNILS